MALSKVRALHPDIFSDEDVSEVSIPARWLFAGLWCFACDNGHLQDKPKQIKRWIYATDDENVAELLRELEGQGLIVRADGWIHVPGLRKRQRIDWRYFKTCERDDCEKPDRKSDDSQPETRRGNDGHPQSPVVATRGPATDGDGDDDGDGDGDGDGERSTSSDKSDKTQPPEHFDEFWETYGNKVGRAKCETAYRVALKKPGVTAELLIAATDAYVLWCRETDTFLKNPLTWLHGEHWRDERTARRAPLSNVDQHLALARDMAEREGATIHEIGGAR